jgi:large subunit ribosomal protein L1
MHSGKIYREALKAVEKGKRYTIEEAVDVLKSMPRRKFDEGLVLSIKLGVDPKDSTQQVRGVVRLPHGTGKKVKVAVIAKGEKFDEAKEAGADFVGGQDLVDKISKGWLDFEALVAAPDMMRDVGKLGKILGPRGLMPSPKSGTVTFEIARTVKEIKSGRTEFRMDKTANLHLVTGKISFKKEDLVNNIRESFSVINSVRPKAAKGQFLTSVTLSTTMSPGVKLDARVL